MANPGFIFLLTFFSSIVLFIANALAQNYEGLNEASGVNQTLNEPWGARSAGSSITFAGFQIDADAALNAPASMNDVDHFTFSTSHSEKFGKAKFDALAFLYPLDERSTLGFGIARFGVSGIQNWKEGETQPTEETVELFSIADYQFSTAFSRAWGPIDMGLNLNLLYRQLDQDGVGLKGDAMIQYTWQDKLRIGTLIKGLLPSSASWQSGYSEYEPTDIFLGIGAKFPTPYFYGTLALSMQSEGLFQAQAKSSHTLKSSRIYENPGELFSSTHLGIEYFFDFGMTLRMGCNEIFPEKDFASTLNYGIGFQWRNILGLDYSFSPHPDLLSTHRISLQLTPSFPKFEGRNFRSHQNPITNKAILKPIPQKPVQETKEASPPEKVEPPVPGSNQEILDTEEESL